MTDEQLLIIEARAGVLKTTMTYPAMWNLDSNAIDFIRTDVPALVAEVRRLRVACDEMSATVAGAVYALRLNALNGIVNQCEHLRDELDELHTERVKLHADIERIGRERDDMARANQELQERLIAQLRGNAADALNSDPERIEAEARASVLLERMEDDGK